MPCMVSIYVIIITIHSLALLLYRQIHPYIGTDTHRYIQQYDCNKLSNVLGLKIKPIHVTLTNLGTNEVLLTQLD